jgi:hypothetical protein
VRILQHLAAPHAGEVLAAMVSQMTTGLGALSLAIESNDLFGVAWAREERRLWDGVCQNATRVSLLGDDADVTAAILDGIQVNVPLEPFELDNEAWGLQHSHVIASMGIFNPGGPTVGTLEVIVNHTHGRALLVDRSRHPWSPSMRLHAVLDRDGFEELHRFVEQAVTKLPWAPFDWFDVRFDSAEVHESVRHGLRGFALRRLQDVGPHDFGRHAFALLETLDDPWERLREGFQPRASLETDGEAGITWWTDAITDARNIDNHIAYLRSAWEGATRWIETHDPSAAQNTADGCIREVRARGGTG